MSDEGMARPVEAYEEASERLPGERTYQCGAGERCVHGGLLTDFPGEGAYGKSDRYGIYAGKWHDDCWDQFGYGQFVFDESFAGEHLEPEDY